METIARWLSNAWNWLRMNSPQMQVIAAVAAVVVAGFGVWYARRYVRLTRDLAAAANAQAQAAAAQAEAAANQAHVTQQTLEAAHRPTLEVTFVAPGVMFFQNEGNYAFPFRLHNHGSVPAVLMGWQGMVRLNGHNQIPVTPPSGTGRALFPHSNADFNFSNVHGPAAASPLGTEVEITVDYHAPSAPAVVHRTRVVGTFAGGGAWNIEFPELT